MVSLPFSKPTPDKRMDEMSIPNNRRGQEMRKGYTSTRPKKPEFSQFTTPIVPISIPISISKIFSYLKMY